MVPQHSAATAPQSPSLCTAAAPQFPSAHFYGGRLRDAESITAMPPAPFYTHPLMKVRGEPTRRKHRLLAWLPRRLRVRAVADPPVLSGSCRAVERTTMWTDISVLPLPCSPMCSLTWQRDERSGGRVAALSATRCVCWRQVVGRHGRGAGCPHVVHGPLACHCMCTAGQLNTVPAAVVRRRRR